MLKNTFFLVTLILCFSCQKEEVQKEAKKESKIEKLKIYNLLNYAIVDELINDVLDNSNKEIPFSFFKLKFKDELIERKITLTYLDESVIACYKSRNVIEFGDEGIYKNNKKVFENDYEDLFKRDFLNFKEIPNLSEHPDKFVIRIYSHNLTIEKLQDYLILIRNAYTNLNSNYRFRIDLLKREYYKIEIFDEKELNNEL